MRAIDEYFLKQEDPLREYLLALREIIMHYHPDITEAWKYGMPFYNYRGKMFCYLWVHKKYKLPYIGIVEGKKIDEPDLLQEKRARMKILLLDPQEDIPQKRIHILLKQMLALYA